MAYRTFRRSRPTPMHTSLGSSISFQGFGEVAAARRSGISWNVSPRLLFHRPGERRVSLIESVADDFDSDVRERGRSYFEYGAVEITDANDHRVRALVR